MRLREIITIYLAIGAPLATTYFLRRRARAGDLRALLSSMAVAALWPLAALMLVAARRRRSGQTQERAGETRSQGKAAGAWLEAQMAGARDGLLTALRRIEQLAPETLCAERTQLKQAARDARRAVERYVVLALAVAEVSADAAPSPQEMELSRIAGRAGDDLLLAARCVRRRNVARLAGHQARARAELLEALAATRELARGAAGNASSFIPHAKLLAARRLSEAALAAYVRAIELFSILDDARAVRGVALLLDAECGRLRRLEALRPQPRLAPTHGGASCEPSTLSPSTTSPLPLPPRATPAA